jgi:hypothetical protein
MITITLLLMILGMYHDISFIRTFTIPIDDARINKCVRMINVITPIMLVGLTYVIVWHFAFPVVEQDMIIVFISLLTATILIRIITLHSPLFNGDLPMIVICTIVASLLQLIIILLCIKDYMLLS